jgi:large subunit ribosomal protein L24
MQRTNVRIKLKKDDQIKVIAGREKGKEGKILKIDRVNNRVYIEGLNMVSKAVRKRRDNQQGGIIEVEAPLHISNVMIICKRCGPTRIGYKIQGNAKLRICKKCGEQL